MVKNFFAGTAWAAWIVGSVSLLWCVWSAQAAGEEETTAERTAELRVKAAQNRFEREPADLAAQLELGQAYYFAGQFVAARNHLRVYLSVCEAGPDSVRAAHIHARSLLASGLRLRATRSFKALVKHPDAPLDASHDLALLLREDNFGPEAIMAEMRVLESDAVRASFLREAASQWKELRELPQSILVFEKLRDAGNTDGADYFELGYLYHRLRRYETARRYYETTLAEDDGHPEAHYNLAVLDQRVRAMDSAVFHLREVMRIRPAYEPVYFELAQIFLGQERNLEAEQVFLQYLEVGQDSSAIHEAKSIIEELRYERQATGTGG